MEVGNKKASTMKFTFKNETKSGENVNKRVEELIKKRNEILALKGIYILSEEEEYEKMKSGILGFAIGDALGVPVEFFNRELLQQNPVKDMKGYGSYNVPGGTWSDDTSLMLAAMDSIKENETVYFDDIMHKFTEWYTCAKYTATDVFFDVGNSTLKSIYNFMNGQNATECGGTEIYENGNGSLMRILPFVYYIKLEEFTEIEKIDLINQASSLTHAHEISRLGCKIFSDYIIFLLEGKDKLKAWELLSKIDYSKYYSMESIKQYERILNGSINNLEINDIKSTGYVVDTLEASIWCTLKNNDFESSVMAAVNLGNDTDTIGAITGAINGIIYGRESIPERWLEKLKRKEYLEELTEEFLNVITGKKKKTR